jgi:hypothetical protein
MPESRQAGGRAARASYLDGEAAILDNGRAQKGALEGARKRAWKRVSKPPTP